MQPYLEIPVMPESFPIKLFTTSTLVSQIQVHPHWHKEIEILYFYGGEATQQVGDCFFDVNSDDIVIIGGNQLHSTYSCKGTNCKVLVLIFDISNFITPVMSPNENKLLNEFCNGFRFFSTESIDKCVLKKMADCLLNLYKEYTNTGFTHELIIRSRIYEFAAFALQNGKQLIDVQKNELNRPNTLHMLKNTFKLINENFSEDITLSKAATASNLSVTHFCRLFKDTTGMTFNEYLNFYRINRAEKMLFSSVSVSEVALECGFGSISSFIRNFKKYKKCTPSLYKHQQNEL